MTTSTSREKMLDVREERRGAERLEMREDGDGSVILEGYAATYDSYDVHGGPNAGGWIEQLGMEAFDKTLSSNPDVQLLVNHEGLPLARTKSGTLKLSRDRHGLRVWAKLDASDPDVQRLTPKMRRGDLNEMSFAFRVLDQSWDTGYTHRTINELSLQKGDVSVVNYGMNPGTRAVISADAVGVLAQLSQQELVELRKLDQGKVRRAAAALAAVAGPMEVGMGSVRVPEARKPKDKPYGNVTYADPGYKSDGKKRYPIDSEDHVRAAWSYINMPKNQKGYSSAQVNSIKGRIQSAAKKYGVEISEGKSAAGLSHIDTVVRADGNTSLVAVLNDGTRVPLPRQHRAGDQLDVQWKPSDSPQDPHDEPYDEGMVGTVGAGPVPENIQDGGDSFSGTPEGDSDLDEDETDPHDTDYDAEMLAMDHHDDPYDLNPQVGASPSGPVAPNIITSGGGGSVVNVTTPPAGTNRPVEGSGKHDWTTGTISEPADPDEDLNASAARPDIGMRGISVGASDAGSDKGHAAATHGEQCGDDWAPTNIVCDADGDNDSPERPVEMDLCMAEALDRTIVHAYKLAADNTELRKALAVARSQLNTMRGIKPQRHSDVSRKLTMLRQEVGAPNTSTVSGGLAYIRSAGSAPVGYQGLTRADPGCHVTTGAERLLKDSRDKEARARKANKELVQAQDRVKAAEREAELNDAIRRRHRAAEL